MIGMGFGAFLVIFIGGLIAAAVVHYVARYRFLEGFDGFLGKLVAGWFGAWLGSPVFGHWFGHFEIAGVYIIPALLGAFTAAFASAAAVKAAAKALAPGIASGAQSPGQKAAA
jgi:uncharacterized membrane protein YeaQ/YmgE (transglycosylase-associated protein family)